jgi:hypothetical protein
MAVDRTFLMRLRSILIELLNCLDDSLGLPRTIPSKAERRLQRHIDVT